MIIVVLIVIQARDFDNSD